MKDAKMNDETELTNRSEEKGGCLCFLLGVFGIAGVLIAAIIAKKQGVIAALWGWFISWLACTLFWFAAAALLAIVD